MNLKSILIFLIFIIGIVMLIIAFSEFPSSNNTQNETSFLDDLLAAVFGTGSSGGGYYYPPISCQPEIIIFNISLNKGELYTYKEEKNVCGDIINTTSTYFIEEYNTSNECYTIRYKTQYIQFEDCESFTIMNRTTKKLKNITIKDENGTFLLCNKSQISCKDYGGSPFFGLIDKNFKVTATFKQHLKYRYGLYTTEGDVYPKTEMFVVGEEKLNGKDTYVVKKVREIGTGHKKNLTTEIFSTSYLWVDKNTGVVLKAEDYLGEKNEKMSELELINLTECKLINLTECQ